MTIQDESRIREMFQEVKNKTGINMYLVTVSSVKPKEIEECVLATYQYYDLGGQEEPSLLMVVSVDDQESSSMCTKKINLAVDNIGVEVSYTSNNIVQSSSKYFDLTDMKLHYKTSVMNQLDDMEESEYTDIGIGGLFIVGALAYVAGGIGTIALPVMQLLR